MKGIGVMICNHKFHHYRPPAAEIAVARSEIALLLHGDLVVDLVGVVLGRALAVQR